MERDSLTALKIYILWDFSFSSCTDYIYTYTYMNWFSLILPTVLGFAVNILTVVMVVVPGFSQRIDRGVRRSDGQVLADLRGFWEGTRKKLLKKLCQNSINWSLYSVYTKLTCETYYPVVLLCNVLYRSWLSNFVELKLFGSPGKAIITLHIVSVFYSSM